MGALPVARRGGRAPTAPIGLWLPGRRCAARSTGGLREPVPTPRRCSAWAWDDAGDEAAARGGGPLHGTGSAVGCPPRPSTSRPSSPAQDADTPPGPVVDAPAAPSTFRYRVRNTGNVTAVGRLGARRGARAPSPARRAPCAPGEQMICLVPRTAEAGPQASAAEARGLRTPPAREVTDEDSAPLPRGGPGAGGGRSRPWWKGFDGDTPPGPRVRPAGGDDRLHLRGDQHRGAAPDRGAGHRRRPRVPSPARHAPWRPGRA